MDKKIKICFIVAVDITIKLILINYLRRFKNSGYEVWAVCSPGAFLEEIKKDGINVKEITIKRKLFSPVSDLLSLLKLVYFLKKEKFDIVQVQTPKAAFLGQLASKLAKIPIVINNNFGFYFENFSLVKKNLFIFFEKLSAKYTDLMFAINREDMQTAIKEKIFTEDKIKYLGFGINTKRFDPGRFSKEFILQKKRELGIPEGKKVIGIVARLVEEKGYLELFEAFGKVIKNFPDALLLIIGIEEPNKKDGVKIGIIKKYNIEKETIFLGDREDVDELYSVMDIFVLPTHREGLGNTILEASAMGKPVIATNIRGCRESVDDNKTGLLVPVKNPKELAKAILFLLNNPQICLNFGQVGRDKIIKNFNEDRVFQVLINEYNALIKEKLCK
jgi:glycosyltransferase involved in cell wall biosynthesis